MNSMTFLPSHRYQRSKFTLVFFKAACHGNPGAVRKGAVRSLYISRHVTQKFSNISANNNVLP